MRIKTTTMQIPPITTIKIIVSLRLSQFISSLPSKQPGYPSHTLYKGIQDVSEHLNSSFLHVQFSSSELSPQWLCLSHTSIIGMHFPLEHLNSSLLHVQFSSS
uniref:Uncharacterized protein n=1 Tax=Cacopsylla melanoneura TaxID=428564 RepID=A0A8D8RNE6_9HEMI